MSRNFELIRQLEIDMGGQHIRTATSARAVVPPFAPVNSDQISDTGADDMSRFVQRVFLSGNDCAPRQVVFCGVDDKYRSSYVCASAGKTLAERSKRTVCLVDANLLSPDLKSILGVNETSLVPDPSAPVLEHCIKIGTSLWLAGPQVLTGNGHVLPPVDQLKGLLAQLRDRFDFLLIDAPGTSVSGDAQLLGRVADAAILVIDANSTRRLTARKAKESLDAAGVKLLGTVLSNRQFPIPELLYRRL